MLEGFFVDRMEGNEEIFAKIMTIRRSGASPPSS
jgi:hypothetical protein